MALPRFEKEWNGFRGHVAVKWDKLNDDDLVKIEGNFSDLVKLITERYDEKKAVVESKLKDLYTGYLETKERIATELAEAREDLGAKSHDISESLKQKAASLQKNAREQIIRIREEGIDPAVQKSEEYIKVHPFSAVLAAFGVGILMGGVIGLLTRSKD